MCIYIFLLIDGKGGVETGGLVVERWIPIPEDPGSSRTG